MFKNITIKLIFKRISSFKKNLQYVPGKSLSPTDSVQRKEGKLFINLFWFRENEQTVNYEESFFSLNPMYKNKRDRANTLCIQFWFCSTNTHLRMHRQILPPDVSLQNPNLCLLSMSVSTKVKCCPTWFWDTLKCSTIKHIKPCMMILQKNKTKNVYSTDFIFQISWSYNYVLKLQKSEI